MRTALSQMPRCDGLSNCLDPIVRSTVTLHVCCVWHAVHVPCLCLLCSHSLALCAALHDSALRVRLCEGVAFGVLRLLCGAQSGGAESRSRTPPPAGSPWRPRSGFIGFDKGGRGVPTDCFRKEKPVPRLMLRWTHCCRMHCFHWTLHEK